MKLTYTMGCVCTSLDVDGKEFNIDLTLEERRNIASILLNKTNAERVFEFIGEIDIDSKSTSFEEADKLIDEFDNLSLEVKKQKAIQYFNNISDKDPNYDVLNQEIFCKVLECDGKGGYLFTCEQCGDSVYEYTITI